jgi:hypothetical protein
VFRVVDVDASHVGRELADPLQFLLRHRPESRINFYVFADYNDVHVLPIVIPEVSPPEGRSERSE